MHDVFISHSSKDKAMADAACHALERAGVRCWIAPRDETAGVSYARQIGEAIQASSVMVLVFSSHANVSKHVNREVGLALEAGAVVIPYRIEEVTPVDELSYLLHGLHWLDAYPDTTEFDPLVDHVRRNLVADPSLAGHVGDPSGGALRRTAVRQPLEVQLGSEPARVAPSTVDRTEAQRPTDLPLGQGLAPGVRLVGQVLSGRSFAGVRAKGATLSKSVFRKCDFTGAVLDSSVLSSVNFEGSRLDGASFHDARMDFVNLLGASCVEAKFHYARMTRADVRRADLTRANLHLLDGTEANFEDAVAVGACFSMALLNGADFSSADLTGADFTDAEMEGCRLNGADLRGVQGLTEAQLAVAITDRYTTLS